MKWVTRERPKFDHIAKAAAYVVHLRRTFTGKRLRSTMRRTQVLDQGCPRDSVGRMLGQTTITVACAIFILSPVFAAEKFMRLSAADIRAKIIRKVVTDDAHWWDHFEADGILKSIDLGQLTPGTWKIDGDELCITRDERTRMSTNCYEIWQMNDRVQYRRDRVTIMEGFLRDK